MEISTDGIEVPFVTPFGRGDTQVVGVASPGAGLGFTVPIPGAVEWCIYSVSVKLVTAAGGGTRVPLLSLEDGVGVPFFQAAATPGIAASHTARFTWAANIQPFGVLNDPEQGTSIPELRMYAGTSIVVSVTNLGGSDVISDARLFVRQYPIRPY